MIIAEALGYNQKSKHKKGFWGIRIYIIMYPRTS